MCTHCAPITTKKKTGRNEEIFTISEKTENWKLGGHDNFPGFWWLSDFPIFKIRLDSTRRAWMARARAVSTASTDTQKTPCQHEQLSSYSNSIDFFLGSWSFSNFLFLVDFSLFTRNVSLWKSPKLRELSWSWPAQHAATWMFGHPHLDAAPLTPKMASKFRNLKVPYISGTWNPKQPFINRCLVKQPFPM